MPRIRQLPPNVVTKIAAGEVIERPASVVKELLENSIDAGSTRIDIDIDQGGVERITIVDDGCGIEPDDLPIAFASHATSKLRDADDLFRIGTLGFRGEALASIGGVAQVLLQSRAREAETGAEIQCHGGELSPIRPWNGSPGTRIDVRHLFFNTPVRKKFMKAAGTEFGHISETVTRLALAFPSLHFTLRNNGKLVHDIPATATLPDRIDLFFGRDVRNALYEIEQRRGGMRLYGYIADPAVDRGNAKMQYFFLNGRWFRDRTLSHALHEGYRGLLMVGRYAVGFLFIEMPPDEVDVNVHPTKAEVRFRDSSSVFQLVQSAVRHRLNQANLVPRLQPPEVYGRPPFPMPTTAFPPGGAPGSGPISAATGSPSPAPDSNGFSFPVPPVSAYNPAVFQPPAPTPPETPAHHLTPEALPAPPGGKVLQIHDSYLVIETSDGMLVIDQHALHERILFEQFQRRLKEGPMERQRLLIPEPIDLPADQAARLMDARGELAELGLEIEGFGGGTILVQSYPTLLSRLTPAAIVREIVDFLLAQDRPPTRDILLHDLTAMMACKAAVKAGDRLTPEQIDALLAQRHLAVHSHHCPHGRPTSLIFSRHDLDRQFGRI